MTEPSRNVELKAHDPDPAPDARARARRGRARTAACCASATRTSRVPHGRLKLREEEPGGATLIAYERPDAAPSACRPTGSSPVAEPDALRDALDAPRAACDAVVVKRRRLLLWETVRIHLDEVRGPRHRSSSSRRSPSPARTSSRERAQVARLRELLEIARRRAARGLLRRRADRERAAGGARPGAARAGARGGRPRVRAVLGLPGRRRRAHRPTGAATPARTSRTPPTRRASARRRRRSARSSPAAAGRSPRSSSRRRAAELCTPCGGCRQRLREFAADDAPIHLADLERVRRTTTLAELLPLSFGPEHLAG